MGDRGPAGHPGVSDDRWFTLTFDPNPSPKYPHGYWYAQSALGDYDADGVTPVDALAALVMELDRARLESR